MTFSLTASGYQRTFIRRHQHHSLYSINNFNNFNNKRRPDNAIVLQQRYRGRRDRTHHKRPRQWLPHNMTQFPWEEHTWLRLLWIKAEKGFWEEKAQEKTHQRNQENNLKFPCIMEQQNLMKCLLKRWWESFLITGNANVDQITSAGYWKSKSTFIIPFETAQEFPFISLASPILHLWLFIVWCLCTPTLLLSSHKGFFSIFKTKLLCNYSAYVKEFIVFPCWFQIHFEKPACIMHIHWIPHMYWSLSLDPSLNSLNTMALPYQYIQQNCKSLWLSFPSLLPNLHIRKHLDSKTIIHPIQAKCHHVAWLTVDLDFLCGGSF